MEKNRFEALYIQLRGHFFREYLRAGLIDEEGNEIKGFRSIGTEMDASYRCKQRVSQYVVKYYDALTLEQRDKIELSFYLWKKQHINRGVMSFEDWKKKKEMEKANV